MPTRKSLSYLIWYRCLKGRRSDWSWSRSCAQATHCKKTTGCWRKPRSRWHWPYSGRGTCTSTRFFPVLSPCVVPPHFYSCTSGSMTTVNEMTKKKHTPRPITLSQPVFLNSAASVQNWNGVCPHWTEYGLILFARKKKRKKETPHFKKVFPSNFLKYLVILLYFSGSSAEWKVIKAKKKRHKIYFKISALVYEFWSRLNCILNMLISHGILWLSSVSPDHSC